MFRSDHFTTEPPDQESLEEWVSLTYAASHTRRIELGSLVSPVTFRHPSMLARMAAAIDDLSGGRLVLGMGAGWNEREHRQFGIPFYDRNTRFEMLVDALEITTRLFHADDPVSYTGKHFSLDQAPMLPRPHRPGGPPILIGGNGLNRTLGLAAKYANEWNGVFISPGDYRGRTTRLSELLQEAGRDPASVKRSLMTEVIFANSDSALHAKIGTRSGLSADQPERIIGTASRVVDKIGAYVEAGVERFMLQWLDLDDLEGIEQLANAVLPHFHTTQ